MLFGGVSIFGGRGSIIGVVLSAAIIACLQQAMTLRKIDPQVRNIVTGVLLLLSVIVPNLGEVTGRLRARWRRRPDATSSSGLILAAAANGAPDQIPPSHPTSTSAPSSTPTTTNVSKG